MFDIAIRTNDSFIYVTVFVLYFCHELLDYIIIRFIVIKDTNTKLYFMQFCAIYSSRCYCFYNECLRNN